MNPSTGIALCIALAALAGCQGSSPALQRTEAYLARGEIEQAYWVLTDHCNRNPDDTEARQQLGRMRLVYYLDQGQEKVFRDEDWSAVEDFERVLLVDPDNATAKEWRTKALGKLAARETELGDDARARGKLEEALDHYQRAMGYVPEYADAARGAALVSAVFQARREKGQDNYLKGLRAQAAGLYDQTAYHTQIAIDNDPSLDPARERHLLARRHIAEERLAQAKLAEQRGWYENSVREYRAVFAEFPDLDPELPARIAHVAREAEASAKVNEALVFMYRKQYPEARKILEEAYEMSSEQRARISTHLVALREADLDERYRAALDLELDYRHADALAAFQAIDAEWPGQLDVRTRLQNLKTALDLAREAMARGEAAEKAGDLKLALDAYREALTYAPKFGDLPERVEALRARLEKGKSSGAVPGKAEQATG